MSDIFQKIRSVFPPYRGTPILKAQLRLFYLMLGANVLKGLIRIADTTLIHQEEVSQRDIRLIVISILMMAALHRFPKLIKWGIHYAVIATILHIYYRVFNKSIGADVIALQCIFMVTISAFYGLDKKWGTVYTIIASASIILCHYISFGWTSLHPLPQGLNDIYIAINFMVILISHIYFHGVLYSTLDEKDLLNEELAEVAETKSKFLSTMSHELRTPLNSVIGIAGILIHDNHDSKQNEHLNVLKFSAEGLLALINNILDVNKIESGKLELESTPFNLYTVLNGIARGMEHEAAEKSLRFSMQIDEQIKRKDFLGDPTRLSQIIYNLVGNAIKFTKEGEVAIHAKLVRHTDGLFTVRIEVNDTGIGISQDQQSKIFEPFVQASENTTRKFGGTGLGLSIVKELVGIFGSEIHLKSTPGIGTSFYFDVVFREAKPQSIENIVNKNTDNEILSKLSILLAEDNRMNVYFMRQLFKRWGITADIVENGEEVLASVMNKDYDVILMDMHMPVIDGMEATKSIRLLPNPEKANVYIIALTASVSDNIQKKVKECGMNDYLPKPFQLDELKNKLLDRAALVSE